MVVALVLALLAIGHLAAGLAAHRFLAAEFGTGQADVRVAQGYGQQPFPFLPQPLAGLFSPFARGREMEHERSRTQSRWSVHADVIGEAMLLP